jgi:hypothetical protein
MPAIPTGAQAVLDMTAINHGLCVELQESLVG